MQPQSDISVTNPENSKLIGDFQSYMKGNSTSERHQNNNLKAGIAFAGFLGPDTTFLKVSTKDQVTRFLDTKIKSDVDDPDKRWITKYTFVYEFSTTKADSQSIGFSIGERY